MEPHRMQSWLQVSPQADDLQSSSRSLVSFLKYNPRFPATCWLTLANVQIVLSQCSWIPLLLNELHFLFFVVSLNCPNPLLRSSQFLCDFFSCSLDTQSAAPAADETSKLCLLLSPTHLDMLQFLLSEDCKHFLSAEWPLFQSFSVEYINRHIQ